MPQLPSCRRQRSHQATAPDESLQAARAAAHVTERGGRQSARETTIIHAPRREIRSCNDTTMVHPPTHAVAACGRLPLLAGTVQHARSFTERDGDELRGRHQVRPVEEVEERSGRHGIV